MQRGKRGFQGRDRLERRRSLQLNLIPWTRQWPQLQNHQLRTLRGLLRKLPLPQRWHRHGHQWRAAHGPRMCLHHHHQRRHRLAEGQRVGSGPRSGPTGQPHVRR